MYRYNPHLLLPENFKGRDFIVADIHGYRREVDRFLHKARFSSKKDRLISVGDLIDRGPDSERCLKLLNKPWFWAVRGNHEQLLIDCAVQKTEEAWGRWIMNGGSWSVNQPEAQINRWATKLSKLPLTITVPCQGRLIGICHAEYTQSSWNHKEKATDKDKADWIWGRTRVSRNISKKVKDIDWVFSGHTIVPDVQVLGNSIFIDRGVYKDNGLTVIDVKRWVEANS